MKILSNKNNQLVVSKGQHAILYSYETPVALVDESGQFPVKTEKKWSATTSRHINQFFREHAIPNVLDEVSLASQEELEEMIAKL